MDRSYTSTILHTPSPLDRRSSPSLSQASLLRGAQLAASLAPSSNGAMGKGTTTVQPLSFSPSAVPVRQTQSSFLPSSPAAKTVRFSPAHTSTTSASAFASQYSSAPPSRVQSFATPPRSYSSPSLLRTAQQNYGYVSGTATPPRSQGQSQGQQHEQQGQQGQGSQVQHRASPGQQAKHFLHAGEQKVLAAAAKPAEALGEVKKKLEVLPIGRGEAARRLRINCVLLVAWWVSSRTTMYRFAAGHLVAAAPSLDTPLHICETLLLLLLCYNIIDSLRTLNRLSSLHTSSVTPSLASPRPGPTSTSSTASFSLGSPVRSSPKTRPSPSAFGSASPSHSPLRSTSTSSPFRASALASPSPPTPQTPTSALRGSSSTEVAASSALRRTLGGRASPAQTPGGGEPKDEVGGALLAFEARHSPQNPPAAAQRRVVLESKEDIERLFD